MLSQARVSLSPAAVTAAWSAEIGQPAPGPGHPEASRPDSEARASETDGLRAGARGSESTAREVRVGGPLLGSRLLMPVVFKLARLEA